MYDFAGCLERFLANEGKCDCVADYAQEAGFSGPIVGGKERAESAESAGRAANTERMLYVPVAF